MILANTLYFKSNWKEKFTSVQKQSFQDGPICPQVEMMHGSFQVQLLSLIVFMFFFVNSESTLPFKMFGPFWSVWCKMARAEVGASLP